VRARFALAGANRKVIIVNIAANSGGGNPLFTLLPLILLVGVMYFLFIRPQQRRRREAQELQSAIGPGDEVVTIGGLYGTIVDTDDETVVLEIAPDVQVRYARPAIARTISRAAQEEEDEEEVEDVEEIEDVEDVVDEQPDLAESTTTERRDKK
jgi:preprotein translocase subunit YajC